ncbi:bifunctional adenosylcobinamide kinase/adenosylcobinamide-phosphate guanylyltransferase [Echinimonas agarilytica]|uniref:Bifunctional adenosylcobalamin biosynthesis protein n=1 Tax=Echinimonas agarilytica TaxID=1215918 RepID=A0AA42B923_9GAMM|nr:bifunctional adenosylcobinamide kinase/adenosylcobinamide-phosphate guanylyltransferase [Echinimonas agarilytica]MCM2681143.1 bifunctional adenosylcobinamide kinase/adenosylcobinamide-phosphate guanylyltransferase [Echinimonas agarilytica]
MLNLTQLPCHMLVLGGARSGKSQFAENIIISTNAAPHQVTYVATATVIDDEMEHRIAHHQQSRPSGWALVEEPVSITKVLANKSSSEHLILVDCLTLWLNNLLFNELSDEQIERQVDALCDVIKSSSATIVLVSNEVGQGIVSDNALARRFVDLSGRMNQKLAQAVGTVVLVTAGLPLYLKGGGT